MWRIARPSSQIRAAALEWHAVPARAPALHPRRQLAAPVSAPPGMDIDARREGRLVYGRYRSQRAQETRRRQLQLAAIGAACVVAALLTFSMCARLAGASPRAGTDACAPAPRAAALHASSAAGARAGVRSRRP